MKRRLIISVPASLVLLAVAFYFAAIAWLESSGGREAIEKQLSAAAGIPVRLTGTFDLSLLPVPRAAGSELLLSDPSGNEVVRSRGFRVDLALKPLFQRQFRVDRLELDWLTLGAADGPRFSIPSVAVSGFEPGRATGLDVDLGFLGAVEGTFTWRPEASEVALDVHWGIEGRDPVELAGSVSYFSDYAAFSGMQAVIAGQELAGHGCLLLADRPVLNLDLHAGVLDLAALEAAVPGGQGGALSLPLDINLRLAADEVRRGEMRATGSLLEIGNPPICP